MYIGLLGAPKVFLLRVKCFSDLDPILHASVPIEQHLGD